MSACVDRQIASHAEALPDSAQLQRWVEAVLEHFPGREDAELTIRLVDSDESQALNRDYRGKDAPTNVLSFPFEAPPGLDLPLLGDLVVCHPVVERATQSVTDVEVPGAWISCGNWLTGHAVAKLAAAQGKRS